MSSDRFRAFIALELPEPLRQDLAKLTRLLDAPGAKVKWVGRNQMHLTLKFLGDITQAQADELAKALENIEMETPAFDLEIGGLGAFPNKQKPRVVWIGVEANPVLIAMQAKLERAAVGAGVEPDDREFKPHLTLGRVKSLDKRSELPGRLQEIEVARQQVMADRVSLIRSTLTPEGPIHKVLTTVSPEGAPGDPS